MRKQIHKRLPKDFVEDVIRTFREEKINREQACELLGLSEAQFYRWKEKYSAFN
ncbi:MAG: transposase [Clostridia bacterium]|nr:transposase [Clostridia bacterium]